MASQERQEKPLVNAFFYLVIKCNNARTIMQYFPLDINKNTETFPNIELSDNNHESVLVRLLNGSIEFASWPQDSQKTGFFQRSQHCRSSYDTCSDGAWHQLLFSYNNFRVCHSHLISYLIVVLLLFLNLKNTLIKISSHNYLLVLLHVILNN